MNFNTSATVNYDLNASLIAESIALYGVLVKFLLVEKIGKDDLVFGDFSHIKTNPLNTFNIYGLPENSDMWDNISTNFSQFGMVNNESVGLIVSRASIISIYPTFDASKGFNGIIGNLIVAPSGRLLEITDIQYETPGVNNLFMYSDTKSAYKLSLKGYNNKQVNEVQAGAVGTAEYATLNTYFNELLTDSNAVETAAEVTVSVTQPTPVVDNTEDSVFGRF